MSAIEVTELSVRHGELTAVDKLSFSAEAGQVTALLGPNGAGKTTTVETLQGYHRPAAGVVRVLGIDPLGQPRQMTERVGAMLQEGGVYPAMKAIDAVRLFASYYEKPRDPEGLIDRLGLQAVARTPYRRLSGGEKQRLSMALALAGDPKVLFLDEPTAGVDPQGRAAIRDVIAEAREAGVCVLLTTHDLDEAERLANHVLIIDKGSVVAAGSPEQLRHLGGGDEIRFGGPPGVDVSDLGSHLGLTVVEDRPGEYVIPGASDPSTIARLTAWLAERSLPLADLRAGRQRLEDVFLRLTTEPDSTTAAPKRGRR